MKKRVYLISGLGADQRIFSKLDLSGFEVTYVKWIRPTKNESMHEYAKRLLEQIKDRNPVLIGLSLGGMLAIEISKMIKTEKIILISSAKNKYGIPFYLRALGKLRIQNLIPYKFLTRFRLIKNWMLCATTKEEKEMLMAMARDSDPVFVRWAVNQVIDWPNDYLPDNVIQIHGNSDRLLPLPKSGCNFIIKGGGHLMVVSKADEICKIISGILTEEKSIA